MKAGEEIHKPGILLRNKGGMRYESERMLVRQDLCNVVLFDGEQIISADSLEERNSTEVLSVLGADDKEMQLQKWRDLLKGAVVKSVGSRKVFLYGQ